MAETIYVQPDHQLRQQVSELTNLTQRLDAHVGAVGVQVDQVGQAQQQTRSELAQLSGSFHQFVRRAELTANLQRAETRVGVLENRLDIEFGRYEKVRDTAASLLRAFDSGLVAQETADHATEMLMLESSRYWLAPAARALAAWSAGDVLLCDSAIEEACKLAPQRTSLMFSLVTRRQSRQNASVRWLRYYLDALDAKMLSREFAVVLETVSQGAFGPGARDLIRAEVANWCAQLDQDESAQAAQVARWRFEIEKYRASSAADAFQRLAANSPQWPELDSVLGGAEAHQRFYDHYDALVSKEHIPSATVEDAVDDLLDRLVAEYDDEELPMRRELELERKIIEYEGDKDKAQGDAEASAAALGDTLDYLTLQTTAALDPEAISVSPATQQVALATCAEAVQSAHQSFCADYRAAKPTDVQVAFAEQQPLPGMNLAIGPWSASLTGTAMPELESSLGTHWDAAIVPFLESLRFPFSRRVTKAGIISGLVFLFGLIINPIAGILIGGAVFGIWFARIKKQQKISDAARAGAEETLRALRERALGELRATGAELDDYNTRYSREDRKEDEVRTLIGRFAVLGNDRAAFDTRAVTLDGGI